MSVPPYGPPPGGGAGPGAPGGGSGRMSAGERLAAAFARVSGDRDGLSARDVLALWPKVLDALRQSGADGSSTRLREFVRDLVPRLPIRDRATLERHLKIHDPERMADVLGRNAANATAAAGTVGGFFVLPTKVSPAAMIAAIPIRVAAEAVVVAAIEAKLIGELHEAYGRPLSGTPAARGTAALRLWASYRGLDGADAGGVVGLVSQFARKPASRRAAATMTGKALGRRGLRVGAGVAGAVENRRSTLQLVERVRSELRRAQLGG